MLPGNGGGNCIGAGGGGTERGPENGGGKDLDKGCSDLTGAWFVVCKKFFCGGAVAEDGKDDEEFVIRGILLPIFV